MMTNGKVITRCGDCVHYNFKKHKCNVGYSAEIDPKEKFYADCTTFENVEKYERKAYNKAVDDFAEWLNKNICKGECDIKEMANIYKDEQLKGAKQND